MKTMTLVVAILFAATVAAQDDAKTTFAKLKADYDAEQTAFRAERGKITSAEAFKKLRKEGNRKATSAYYNKALAKIKKPDMKAWMERFTKGADKFGKTEGAIPFLAFVATQRGPQSIKAVDTIIENHIASPALESFAESLAGLARSIGKDEAREAAASLIAENPHASIKLAAHFARFQMLRRSKEPEDRVVREADEKAILELGPDSIAAMRVRGPDFEKNKLQVGMKAPEIMASDLDGVDFKLSDYRGKVVVLDFWGDW